MLKDAIQAMIFWANYHQVIIEAADRLYPGFQTYTDLPTDQLGNSLIVQVLNYTDTADTGDCYLCSINYGVTRQRDKAYILDVLYSQDAQEVTEPATAKLMAGTHRVAKAKIESNNGGRAFARNVKRISREQGNSYSVITWFHQSGNKLARILANSAWVVANVYMPKDWANRWPQFSLHVLTYKRKGKNKYDDAPDCLSGIAEELTGKGKILKATVI